MPQCAATEEEGRGRSQPRLRLGPDRVPRPRPRQRVSASSRKKRPDADRHQRHGRAPRLPGPLEGRLALVYVGAGFNTRPARPCRRRGLEVRTSGMRNESFRPIPKDREPLTRDIGRLTQLQRHRVTVYTIHGGERRRRDQRRGLRPFGAGRHTSATGVSQLTEAGRRGRWPTARAGFFKVNQNLATQLEAVRRDLTTTTPSATARPAARPPRAASRSR